MRVETPPGRQLQIDFSTVRVPVADELLKVHLFVATLSYSRRTSSPPSSTNVSLLGYKAWEALRRNDAGGAD
jgi:transposase